jgi:FdhD protein
VGHDDAVVRRPVTRVTGRSRETRDDALAVERALEMRVDGRSLAVTLRTPGHDRELALGFMASEGILARATDVVEWRVEAAPVPTSPMSSMRARGRRGAGLEQARTPLRRHGRVRPVRPRASGCAAGRAGRATARPPLDVEKLLELPARVRGDQAAFEATGGLHAAVWCDAALEPRVLREDVGRHNAVDKVCGWLMEQGRRPVGEGLLWVSGRAGAELVLKAARAGIPAMASVGAPSSLAVELAEAAGMLLADSCGRDG